jgi:hypothetical protein
VENNGEFYCPGSMDEERESQTLLDASSQTRLQHIIAGRTTPSPSSREESIAKVPTS